MWIEGREKEKDLKRQSKGTIDYAQCNFVSLKKQSLSLKRGSHQECPHLWSQTPKEILIPHFHPFCLYFSFFVLPGLSFFLSIFHSLTYSTNLFYSRWRTNTDQLLEIQQQSREARHQQWWSSHSIVDGESPKKWIYPQGKGQRIKIR